MQPGWYPDPQTGQPRWWDGVQWGAFAQTAVYVDPAIAASRSSASLAHYIGIISFLGPLIIMTSSGTRDPFVRVHAVEALNFHLTAWIGWLVIGIINIVTCGIAFPLAFAIIVPVIYFGIQAGAAANRGEWYRYPWTIRLVT